MEMTTDLKIDESCKLFDTNFIDSVYNKEQIVLCDTHRRDFLHYNYWLDRLDGRYKNTTPFTVDRDGTIYKHYESKYMSAITGNKAIDMKNIYISVANMGSLFENSGKLVNSVGDMFNDMPFECEWRGYCFWEPYTREQIDGVMELCRYLSNEHNIPLKVMRSNTFFNYVADFKGIAYKSNYASLFKDINPSWDFEGFKNNIEDNG